ncbi:7-cyano-7-deazaguanine synthase [Microcoleus sp. C2C3]|uniref:DUF6753 family protein n=1 Tax=unclassified Microcoleus TaxID=2642155 RepID=UPI002FD272C9
MGGTGAATGGGDRPPVMRTRGARSTAGVKPKPTDPIFLILLATGRLEVLIQESPKPEDFELAFDRWVGRINKTLASYERVAVESQEGQIAEAVNSLVRQTELRRVATSAGSLVVAAGILLTTLGIGALMGWMGLLWSQGGFSPGERVHLTQNQIKEKTEVVNYDVLILCSGGLDSVVMTHELLKQGYKCRLFYGNYGKTSSSREIASVKQISLQFGLPVEFVDLKGTTDLQSGYVSIGILQAEELDVGITPESSSDQMATLGRPDGLYITGIYALLSIASYAAQITNINKIALAVTKDQSDTRPTLREALDAWEKCVQLFNPEAGDFKVLSPLIDKTKAEIVSLGKTLEVPFERTWSCTRSDSELPCGECAQCLHRKEAFSLAGVEDKTIYSN